jgi:FkbM family methyltransferase
MHVRQILLALSPPIVVQAARRAREFFNQRPAPELSPPADLRAGDNSRKYWGLNDLDRQIEKYLDFDSGYYVELGANDGRFASNTCYYERVRNWRGVLIEPAPNLFLACRQNRSPRNHVVCAACVSFGYKEEFVKLVYSDSMSVPLNVESDIGDGQAHAELGRQFLKTGETVFTFGAVARTLNGILLEADAPKTIDFLSLDVEGAEIEVLKGIDHAIFKFRYMLIECRNVEKLQQYLAPLQYQLVEKFNEHDYLFASSPPTERPVTGR